MAFSSCTATGPLRYWANLSRIASKWRAAYIRLVGVWGVWQRSTFVVCAHTYSLAIAPVAILATCLHFLLLRTEKGIV